MRVGVGKVQTGCVASCLQQLEALFAGVLQHLPTGLSRPAASELDHLAQQAEVRLVRHERQHDQVGVQAVQAVPLIGLVAARGQGSAEARSAGERSGTHSGCVRAQRRCSMILCSPSPGTCDA